VTPLVSFCQPLPFFLFVIVCPFFDHHLLRRKGLNVSNQDEASVGVVPTPGLHFLAIPAMGADLSEEVFKGVFCKRQLLRVHTQHGHTAAPDPIT
jgi:hypothetical protein